MMSINEIMAVNLITLGPNATLDEAGSLMKEHRIRHVPIVGEDEELLGLITQRDLLAVGSAQADGNGVTKIMRRKVYTVSEESDMRSAALMMQEYKIGALPVLQDKKLVGIITDSDYVALAINLLEQLDEFDPEEIDDYDDSDLGTS
jgi:CBS domain-containing membrane protein